MKHLLSLASQTGPQMEQFIEAGLRMKKDRGKHGQPLVGQTWCLLFSKASTRTRVSFEVGIRELGGWVLYLSPRDSQLGRGEPIRDTARVIGRMAAGAVIRTYAQADVEEFAKFSHIPTINALTDDEHPCQVLADLMTIMEIKGTWTGKKVVFLGDGDNNMSRSWMHAAEKLGFHLVIAAPKFYQPSKEYLSQFRSGRITCEVDPRAAVKDADVLYTDVWVSMGQEEEGAKRMEDLQEYQINKSLMKLAAPGAMVQHCLPAYREKEITNEVLEEYSDMIFQEAENRLHVQKGILSLLTS